MIGIDYFFIPVLYGGFSLHSLPIPVKNHKPGAADLCGTAKNPGFFVLSGGNGGGLRREGSPACKSE